MKLYTVPMTAVRNLFESNILEYTSSCRYYTCNYQWILDSNFSYRNGKVIGMLRCGWRTVGQRGVLRQIFRAMYMYTSRGKIAAMDNIHSWKLLLVKTVNMLLVFSC